MTETTHMRNEILEIPDAAARLLDASDGALAAAGRQLRELSPRYLTTVARGSSDHAASFMKYAVELTAGVPVASVGPSLASIYGARLRLAGAERSVAATKTFVNSAVAGMALMAHCTDDAALLAALADLPARFREAIDCDWMELAAALGGAGSLFILGRGPSLAIANEAALKFKETCAMHAEAYSAAEVMHGPLALVGPGFPILALAARDASEPSMAEAADALVGKGATVFATTALARAAHRLPFAPTGHPLTDPLPLIVSFYAFVEAFARHRGLNPDQPPNLRKVTETI